MLRWIWIGLLGVGCGVAKPGPSMPADTNAREQRAPTPSTPVVVSAAPDAGVPPPAVSPPVVPRTLVDWSPDKRLPGIFVKRVKILERALAVRGAIHASDLQSWVEARGSQLAECYLQGLVTAPKARGIVEIDIDVDATGKPAEPEVGGPLIAVNGALESCMKSALRRQLPAHVTRRLQSAPARLSLTLDFSAEVEERCVDLRVGRFSVRGSQILDPRPVQQLFETHKYMLTPCFEEVLEKDADASGTVDVWLTLWGAPEPLRGIIISGNRSEELKSCLFTSIVQLPRRGASRKTHVVGRLHFTRDGCSASGPR